MGDWRCLVCAVDVCHAPTHVCQTGMQAVACRHCESPLRHLFSNCSRLLNVVFIFYKTCVACRPILAKIKAVEP